MVKQTSSGRKKKDSFRMTASAIFRRRCGFQDGRSQIDCGLCEEKIKIPSGFRTRLISLNALKRASSGITESIPLNAITTASKDDEANADKSVALATSNSRLGNLF